MSGRLIITLDPQSYDPQRLDRCARLAVALNMELCALLIEDQELLSLAALPFSREIVYHSARERDLSPLRLQKLLALLGEQVRQTLHQFEQQHPLQWTLQVDRGHRLESLLRHQSEADLLVTANQKRTEYTRPTYGNGHPPGVMLLHCGDSASETALGIATGIVIEQGGMLDIIALPGSSLHHLRNLPKDTQALPHLHLMTVPVLDIALLRRRIIRTHADLLLAPSTLIDPALPASQQPLLQMPGVQVFIVR